ncbi:MAG: hypothetical protein JJU36_08830 [Phycisphaeraceae bacterium]|nr:hypothetical protein [Phycisphaeraceae bacterium]
MTIGHHSNVIAFRRLLACFSLVLLPLLLMACAGRQPVTEPVHIASGMSPMEVIEQVRRIHPQAGEVDTLTHRPQRIAVHISPDHSRLVLVLDGAGRVVGMTWLQPVRGEGLGDPPQPGQGLIFPLTTVRDRGSRTLHAEMTVAEIESILATTDAKRLIVDPERWRVDGQELFCVRIGPHRLLLGLPEHDWRAHEPHLRPDLVVESVYRVGAFTVDRAWIGDAPVEVEPEDTSDRRAPG